MYVHNSYSNTVVYQCVCASFVLLMKATKGHCLQKMLYLNICKGIICKIVKNIKVGHYLQNCYEYKGRALFVKLRLIHIKVGHYLHIMIRR
jgi:hypothetical protein